MALRTLDAGRVEAVEMLCELIVPGSSRIGPAVYIDALITAMPPEAREGALASIDALAPAAAQGADALGQHERTPEFGVRARARDRGVLQRLRRAGQGRPGAWAEIDFNSPLATRLDKDWSYLGIA